MVARQSALKLINDGYFPDPKAVLAALFPARFVASDALLGTRFWIGPTLELAETWDRAPPELARYMLGLPENALRLWAGDTALADGI